MKVWITVPSRTSKGEHCVFFSMEDLKALKDQRRERLATVVSERGCTGGLGGYASEGRLLKLRVHSFCPLSALTAKLI